MSTHVIAADTLSDTGTKDQTTEYAAHYPHAALHPLYVLHTILSSVCMPHAALHPSWTRVAQQFRPKSDLEEQLPAARQYLVLYLRRGDKGVVTGKRNRLLQEALEEVIHRTNKALPGLPWVVLSPDGAVRREKVALLRNLSAPLHPYTPDVARARALTLNASTDGFGTVQLLQDFFTMSRAAGILTSDPWGNPTLSIAAKWNSGGWLPMYSIDPRFPYGQNAQHRRYVNRTKLFPELRSWFFYDTQDAFVAAVADYVQRHRRS